MCSAPIPSIGVHLQAAGNDFATDLAADIALDLGGHGVRASAQAILVMEELDVRIEQGLERRQIAGVEGCEQRLIHGVHFPPPVPAPRAPGRRAHLPATA
jgi:hypothetical protein